MLKASIFAIVPTLFLAASAVAGNVPTTKTGEEMVGQLVSRMGGKSELVGTNGRLPCKLKIVRGEGRSTGLTSVSIENQSRNFGVNVTPGMKVEFMEVQNETEHALQYRYNFGGMPVRILIYSDVVRKDFAVEIAYENVGKAAYCYFRD